ncbi:hypothetical protein EZV73_04085 [Acidaminobacter sp. JC074]|uniref:HelD family protein n=1 Tax=Acidaminobacter sp. JC074 TaxID=2530199 RepID=UPI001F0E62F6|nr:UvrD-helicase domain-containing protein [Acidaminobacter sp. JC074]MCH4886731.1 hypothetical protein [Acidaminobacter sp. JC074]
MDILKLEQDYHQKTLTVIDKSLNKEEAFLSYLRHDARSYNKEMMEEVSTDYSDPQVRAELSQYLQSFQQKETSLKNSSNKVEKLIRMKDKPYFGRLDFKEDGYDTESLYIGISHLFDDETLDIVVYDWRSPIAGLYYENKYGRLSYESPQGMVYGDVSLKRQFYYDNKTIEAYFDLKENVVDTQLLEVLSSKGDQKLHSVVETIQERQNEIIRTDDIDLLFVKGVPGSGKSIIAMHRLAYLMYHGQKKYTSSNMLIVSPNEYFKEYIDEVLPELGEKSVSQKTFEDFLVECVGDHVETYSHHMDRVMRNKISHFKNTENYYVLLETWFRYYLTHIHEYEDIYYHNDTIVTRQTIKSWYLRHFMKTPLSVGINQLKDKSYSHQSYMQKHVKGKVKDIVLKLNNYPLHKEEAIQRKMTLYNRAFKSRLNKSLNLKARNIYEKMFENKQVLRSLVDFEIPDDFFIRNNNYEDQHGILLYKTWIHPVNDYKHFKYVVIDESQDYNPVQLRVIKALFPGSHFTILGDMNQTLHHHKEKHYEMQLERIFDPSHVKHLSLQTCYRSTTSITDFAGQFIEDEVKAFSRQGSQPEFIESKNLIRDLQAALDRLDHHATTAIIVHTSSEARKLSRKLKDVYAMTGYDKSLHHKRIILPVYFAKGLEFDAVIYLNKKKDHPLHKQFAYTAATRAKHDLVFIE